MFAGYKALIQYETFGYGDPLFAWISFCSSIPKPIGFSDENGILLFPPYGKALSITNVYFKMSCQKMVFK